MKTSHNLSVDSENPQAWIAIQKNRQKVYGSTENSRVYLRDGEEFQIELFNPTQTRYLVKFKINGNYQSNRGLILNPGQRYFLDRFIDEDRKLEFSTYEVENNKVERKAIEKNGLLEVEFYPEAIYSGYTIGQPIWKPYGTGNYWYGGMYWYGVPNGTTNLNTTIGSNGSLTLGGTTTSNGTTFTNTSGTISSLTNSSNYSYVVNDASIETGRVERGEKSDQKFEDGYGAFASWASYTTTVQIIPLSQKPVEAHEIRSYCTGCGSRNKKQNWKFCPNCGTKI